MVLGTFDMAWAQPVVQTAAGAAIVPASAKTFSLAAALGVEKSLMTGLFLGIICASFIYLLSTWAVIRDRGQIFLVLMLLAMMVHVLAAGGYFNSMGVIFSRFLTHGALLVFLIFTTIFTMQYLEYDLSNSHFRYMLMGIIGVLGLMLLAAAIDTLFMERLVPWVCIGVLMLLCIACAASFTMRSVNNGGPPLAAFSVLLFGQLHNIPIDWMDIGIPVLSGDITAITFAICSMLFAVVTASQFARRQERKEFELARSNERFQMAAQGSNEGLYDVGITRGDGYFSDRLTRILGINLSGEGARAALHRFLKIVRREDRKNVRRALFAFLKTASRNTLTLDFRIIRPDRKELWLTATAVVVREPFTGRPVRIVGAVGDVTEKKRAEVRMKASERRFRSIAEAHPVPVIIATVKEGEVVFASDGAEKLLRTAVGQLRGSFLDNFFVDSDQRRTIMDDMKKTGQVELREATLRRAADKKTFPAAISARMIDYERRPCAVLGLYDLSERKTAENRIKDAEAALQQSEKLAALGGLLAGVAHELNNPLSVIVGQAVLMRESAKDEKVAQRSDKIQKAGERCSRIVRSFLALARRKPTERVAIDINDVVESSLELLAFQLRTDNVELIKKFSGNLPKVMADADQMTQVITNLIVNAKHALGEKQGTRTITVETKMAPPSKTSSDEYVQITVSDNGPGVPKEIAKRIFEPFFTTKPAGTGTGVGLSLCHNIVESHGGRISVKDAIGGGAAFVFTLPISTEKASKGTATAAVAADYHVPPQRILIVDDEVELAQTLADILAPDQHATTIVNNGQQALDMLATQSFDFIISDLRMPVLDGPGLYRALEKSGSPYISRIIFVTGDTLSIPVREFITSYALDVIEKPYTPEDVRRAIADRVRRSGNLPPVESQTGGASALANAAAAQ